MQRNNQRRSSGSVIGLMLVLVAVVVAVAIHFDVLQGFRRTVPVESTQTVTILRGGNAWGSTPANPGTSARTIVGPVTHVRDGDTIEVSGRPIRFAKLDCPELGTPDGRRAGKLMQELVSGKTVSCALTGRKSYDRWIGSCRLPDGRDLSSVLVKTGGCDWW